MFKLNGERQRIKGENGVPATILLNGVEASIQEHINDGDVLQVELATNGNTPECTVGDLVHIERRIILEDETYTLPLVKANGKVVSRTYKIMPNDEIEVVTTSTLGELLENLEISMTNKCITKEFVPLDSNYVLQDGDRLLVDIIVKPKENKEVSKENSGVDEFKPNEAHEMASEVDEEQIEETQEDADSKLEAQASIKPAQEKLYIMANGQMVSLPKKETDYIFACIFDYIQFDLSKPQGTVQLVRNGESAALTDVLKDGDVLEIYWKK